MKRMSTSQIFSERLRIALHRRKMTQVELGNIVGISPKSISKYINQLTLPPADTLHKIADALNVSVDWLLGRTDEEADIYIERDEEPWANDVKIIRRGIQQMSGKERRVLINLVKSYVEEMQKEEKTEGGEHN